SATPTGTRRSPRRRRLRASSNSCRNAKATTASASPTSRRCLRRLSLEVFVGHQVQPHEIATDEHILPIVTKLSGLHNHIESVFLEAKWFHAQAERQNQLAQATTRKLVVKTAVQSLALITCSFLQVYLLRRLFEKKLGRTMV
ncbi:unnamed protein product, partial [Closterium sp. Yama58-4]